ncbi:MAG: hypothetical protein NC217_04100 [Muribaculaceae bacterium]|nr:hypothetical protein [Muribaculaceae bacterium]
MKKILIFTAACLALAGGACSKSDKSADSAESVAAVRAQLEAERSEAFNEFKDKTVSAMTATVDAVKADPTNAQQIYDEFIHRMGDLHLQNAEFMQELMADSTYQAEGRKFKEAMTEAGINTNPLDTNN